MDDITTRIKKEELDGDNRCYSCKKDHHHQVKLPTRQHPDQEEAYYFTGSAFSRCGKTSFVLFGYSSPKARGMKARDVRRGLLLGPKKNAAFRDHQISLTGHVCPM